MTHETTHHATSDGGGSAALPMLGSAILTAIWGAYTVWVALHIFTIPLPPYPG